MLAGELSKAKQFLVLEIVAHEMGLHIEDELAGEALRPRQHHFGIMLLGGFDLEDRAVDLVHGEEGCRHAAARAHELAAAQAQPPAVEVRQRVYALLDPLLRGTLRGRQILAVRHDLGRYRRSGGGFLGPCDKALFSFTEPTTHRRPPLSLIDPWSTFRKWPPASERGRTLGPPSRTRANWLLA